MSEHTRQHLVYVSPRVLTSSVYKKLEFGTKRPFEEIEEEECILHFVSMFSFSFVLSYRYFSEDDGCLSHLQSSLVVFSRLCGN